MSHYVLCLDGGGVRGIITLQVLKRLETDLQINIFNQFDMFVGSSSGALISLSIVSQNKIKHDILTNEKIHTIMPKMCWNYLTRKLPPIWGPRYNGQGKQQVIADNMPDISMNELSKPTFVSTYCLKSRRPKIFSNKDSFKIRNVADAASAAPTYFPPVSIDGAWYIDGGVAVNNPSTVGFVEALKRWPLETIKILSIGTGVENDPINGKDAKKWGLFGWGKNNLVDVLMNAPNKIATRNCRELLKENYLRIETDLGDISETLDDTRESNLNALKDLGNKWFDDNKDKLKIFFQNN